MNFFKSQDIARRNTTLLVVLFALAVLSLILITNLILMFAFSQQNTTGLSNAPEMQNFQQTFNWKISLGVAIAIIVVVSLGSLYKISSLSGGGARVAEMMDAKLLINGSHDLNQKKMLNVVEEMAIASGTPVPPVYLLEEDGINAFAAGYTPGDAVIGVTRGAIEKLSREQLQGVVAHEFSHIFNGDMRLNIRLIGILYGIMLMGTIGYYMLRSSSRSRQSKNGGGIIALAIAFMVIGYAGTFFGNLIKAAVSRQREFLADATAVQYTRNPDSIAGALKRIGGDAFGSHLNNANAAEIGHTLFGEGMRSYFGGLYATHPPLEKRIFAIDPGWDGEFDDGTLITKATTSQPSQEKTGAREKILGNNVLITTILAALADGSLLNQTGQPDVPHLKHTQQLLKNIPTELLSAAHQPSTARAVVFLLLLDNEESIRNEQLKHLQNNADSNIYITLTKLLEQQSIIKAEYRLPLVEIALSALRQLSTKQYDLFKINIDTLIKSDKKISLFEWSMHTIITRSLDAVLHGKPDTVPARHSLKQLSPWCEILLSLLAHTGASKTHTASSIFQQASLEIGLTEIKLLDKNHLDIKKLNQSVEQLIKLKPLKKPQLLKACALCITADHKITPEETELFRAIAICLNCPMPPLIL